MNNSIDKDKNEIIRLRIFTLFVVVIMLGAASLMAKSDRINNHRYMNKLEMFSR